MIVVDPNNVAPFPILDNLVRKRLVDFLRSISKNDPRKPCFWIVGDLVVENWPQDGLAIVRVVAIEVAIIHKDRQAFELVCKLIVDIGSLSIF
jgi:hypothetical protein